MLRAARQVAGRLPVRVATTFLGAHALPPEFAGRPDDYVDALCTEMLPQLARQGLVDAVDAFCERIGFTHAQTERVFEAARKLGLPVKLHAEQLSDQGGAALVARYGGTVPVVEGAPESTPPPVAALREAGVPMAIATDCNPGTSPMTSLLLAMNMACTLWRLTPQEALLGATIHGARALGLHGQIGTLEVGKVADMALWDIARPADLAYAKGSIPCRAVVNGGIVRAAHIAA